MFGAQKKTGPFRTRLRSDHSRTRNPEAVGSYCRNCHPAVTCCWATCCCHSGCLNLASSSSGKSNSDWSSWANSGWCHSADRSGLSWSRTHRACWSWIRSSGWWCSASCSGWSCPGTGSGSARCWSRTGSDPCCCWTVLCLIVRLKIRSALWTGPSPRLHRTERLRVNSFFQTSCCEGLREFELADEASF